MSDYDEWLLEAMREVDELTPACPPIAPPRLSREEIERAKLQMASNNQGLWPAAQNQQAAFFRSQALAQSYMSHCLMCGETVPREVLALGRHCHPQKN